MTRETKVGLLVGMGVILLIGIIVSDHLAIVQQEDRNLPDFATQAQGSIQADGQSQSLMGMPGSRTRTARGTDQRAAPLQRPIPTSDEVQGDIRGNRNGDWRRSERGNPDGAGGVDRVDSLPDQQQASNSYPLEVFAPYDTRGNAGQQSATSSVAHSATSSRLPSEHATRAESASRQTSQGNSLTIGPSYEQLASAQSTHQTSVQPQRTELARESGHVERAHEASPIIHHVKPNETLYEIAEQYMGDGRYWRVIRDRNPDLVTANGGVQVGARLEIPTENLPRTSHLEEVAQRADAALQGDGHASSSRRNDSSHSLKTIEVKSGDTLSDLAARHLGSSRHWRKLLEANRDKLETARDLRAGMTLKLPADMVATASPSHRSSTTTARRVSARSSEPKTYVVQKGDTLTRIAEQKLGDGSRWRELYKANRQKIKDPDNVPVGTKLLLPTAKSRSGSRDSLS